MKSLVPAMAALALVAGSAVASADDPLAPNQCPEVLRGVAFVVRPVAGGVALEFTSPRQHEVPELREQLRDAALVIEMHSKASMQPVSDPAETGVRIPPVEISVNDVAAGARVIIRAQRAGDLPALLELVGALEVFWARSDCNPEARAHDLVMLAPRRA